MSETEVEDLRLYSSEVSFFSIFSPILSRFRVSVFPKLFYAPIRAGIYIRCNYILIYIPAETGMLIKGRGNTFTIAHFLMYSSRVHGRDIL
jgi:hypothetical protein